MIRVAGSSSPFGTIHQQKQARQRKKSTLRDQRTSLRSKTSDPLHSGHCVRAESMALDSLEGDSLDPMEGYFKTHAGVCHSQTICRGARRSSSGGTRDWSRWAPLGAAESMFYQANVESSGAIQDGGVELDIASRAFRGFRIERPDDGGEGQWLLCIPLAAVVVHRKRVPSIVNRRD